MTLGILTPSRLGFTPEQRAYFYTLLHQGMDPKIAKEMALLLRKSERVSKGGPGSGPHKGDGGGSSTGAHLFAASAHLNAAKKARSRGDHETAEKHMAAGHARLQAAHASMKVRATTKSAESEAREYHRRFVRQARQELDPEIYDKLHRKARNITGGKNSRRKKMPGYIGGIDLAGGFNGSTGAAPPAAVAKAVVDPQKMRDAQRLVAGMDFHMHTDPSMDAEAARTHASGDLRRQPFAFTDAFRPAWAPDVEPGIQLDVACGSDRLPGFLGLDGETYGDHGTALWNPLEGLPCPEGTCTAIHMRDVLERWQLDVGQATAFVQDVASKLAVGGRLFYEGEHPLGWRVDMAQVPMLRLVDAHDQAADQGRSAQVFERQAVMVPAIYGADAEANGVPSFGNPMELALAAMGMSAKASEAMRNLVQKKRRNVVLEEQKVRILKKDDWQKVVLSVVYAPDEFDTDNEYMEARDIEEAAHNCMKNGAYVGSEHGGVPLGAHIVESYISPATFQVAGPYGEQTVPKGAWVMGIKFDCEKEWAKVVDGTYQGFSLGGYALRAP